MTAVTRVRLRTGRAYHRFRASHHPVTQLRWLRDWVVLFVFVAAGMYLGVALTARQDIAAVNRTDQAIQTVASASADSSAAQMALVYALGHGGAAPSPGDGANASDTSSYTARILDASENIARTAQDVLGPRATADSQPISEDLTVYLELSDTAVADYDISPRTGRLPAAIAAEQERNVQSALNRLLSDERETLRAQRAAWPLDPATFWWALLGPVIVIALLVEATGCVLAGHFRCRPSRWLWVALTATAATTVTTGLFAMSDEQSLSADPWAGHPATVSVALLVYAAAAAAAYWAYRPRLAEYRF